MRNVELRKWMFQDISKDYLQSVEVHRSGCFQVAFNALDEIRIVLEERGIMT